MGLKDLFHKSEHVTKDFSVDDIKQGTWVLVKKAEDQPENKSRVLGKTEHTKSMCGNWFEAGPQNYKGLITLISGVYATSWHLEELEAISKTKPKNI